MTYVMIVVAVLAVGALVMWAASGRQGGGRDSVDHHETTGRGARPTPSPARPVPGSAPDRARHGQP